MPEWKLILTQSFGDVLPEGRWDHTGAALIADACNTGDWTDVEEYAGLLDWDDDRAN